MWRKRKQKPKKQNEKKYSFTSNVAVVQLKKNFMERNGDLLSKLQLTMFSFFLCYSEYTIKKNKNFNGNFGIKMIIFILFDFIFIINIVNMCRRIAAIPSIVLPSDFILYSYTVSFTPIVLTTFIMLLDNHDNFLPSTWYANLLVCYLLLICNNTSYVKRICSNLSFSSP